MGEEAGSLLAGSLPADPVIAGAARSEEPCVQSLNRSEKRTKAVKSESAMPAEMIKPVIDGLAAAGRLFTLC